MIDIYDASLEELTTEFYNGNTKLNNLLRDAYRLNVAISEDLKVEVSLPIFRSLEREMALADVMTETLENYPGSFSSRQHEIKYRRKKRMEIMHIQTQSDIRTLKGLISLGQEIQALVEDLQIMWRALSSLHGVNRHVVVREVQNPILEYHKYKQVHINLSKPLQRPKDPEREKVKADARERGEVLGEDILDKFTNSRG